MKLSIAPHLEAGRGPDQSGLARLAQPGPGAELSGRLRRLHQPPSRRQQRRRSEGRRPPVLVLPGHLVVRHPLWEAVHQDAPPARAGAEDAAAGGVGAQGRQVVRVLAQDLQLRHLGAGVITRVWK